MAKFTRAAPNSPRLDLFLRHTLGACELDVAFRLTHPWTILFGPSGSGKSTILRAIAGLLRPATARIVWTLPIGDDAANGFTSALTFVDTAAGLFVPPHQRQVPLAPQSPSLFPHRTVQQNVAYSAYSRHLADAPDFPALLALFHLTPLAAKLPHTLSGGEAQRVNLARACAAAQPGGLLLLDEPFTGMDLTLRTELIPSLQAWAARHDIAVLSVTHDIAEAYQLQAEVIQLRAGRILQQGPAPLVLAEERTRLLAQLTPP